MHPITARLNPSFCLQAFSNYQVGYASQTAYVCHLLGDACAILSGSNRQSHPVDFDVHGRMQDYRYQNRCTYRHKRLQLQGACLTIVLFVTSTAPCF